MCASVEPLESRMLLSASNGLEPGDSTSLVIDGVTVQARAGEWIVLLEAAAQGASNIVRSVEDSADTWVTERLPASVTFERYLGLDTMFLVRAPMSASSEQLRSLLSHLPGFVSVEPNAITRIAARARNAGDVTAQFGDPIESPYIIIQANSQSNDQNSVILEPRAGGGIQLRGIEGTTVNGSMQPWSPTSQELQATQGIRIILYGGRD